jgi:hypothetical protein
LYLQKLGQTFTIQEIAEYIDRSSELQAVREGERWRPYARLHAARKAAADLRRKVNEPELVEQSKIRLLQRGYGAVVAVQ